MRRGPSSGPLVCPAMSDRFVGRYPDVASIPTLVGETARIIELHFDSADGAVVPLLDPEFPPLTGIRAGREGSGWVTELEFAAPVDVGAVVGLDRRNPSLVELVETKDEASLTRRRTTWQASKPEQPSVSILLATRRPEMLPHALAQVARQRGVHNLQLVLASHGFSPDWAGLPANVTVAPADESTAFGDVLAAASARASGDVVLKMDDDDWYAPDFVADLLMAREFSGADVVGMPADWQYIEPVDATIRRGHKTECFATFVAGGTIMIGRDVLAEVGGWRSVRKYVDAQLLTQVRAAGGSIYRTHGFGYLLRRRASGHTWEVDLAELLDPAKIAERLDGFRPPATMELDAP